jgi:predicted ATPase
VWKWDLLSIGNMRSTDNVVEFLVSALGRLPEHTLRIINLGSCFGNSFDLRLIAGCASVPLAQAENDVWNAMRSGKRPIHTFNNLI